MTGHLHQSVDSLGDYLKINLRIDYENSTYVEDHDQQLVIKFPSRMTRLMQNVI